MMSFASLSLSDTMPPVTARLVIVVLPAVRMSIRPSVVTMLSSVTPDVWLSQIGPVPVTKADSVAACVVIRLPDAPMPD